MTEFNFSEKEYKDPEKFLAALDKQINQLVDNKMAEFDARDSIEFVRYFVGMLADHDMVSDPTQQGGEIRIAIEAQYCARLFLKCFDHAYSATSQHVDNIAKLNKSFEL